MRLRTVTVKDRMQQGFVYALVEPDGRNFNPEFRPELTPAEMLKLGVLRREVSHRLPRRVPCKLVQGCEALAGKEQSVS